MWRPAVAQEEATRLREEVERMNAELVMNAEVEGERAARETEGGVREGEHAAAVEALRGDLLAAQQGLLEAQAEGERLRGEVLLLTSKL